MVTKATIASFCGVVLATACTNVFDCTLVETFPLEIFPVDIVSGASIADSVTATASLNGRDWAFEPYRSDPAGRLSSLWGGGGPGSYRIAVQHPRYNAWDTTQVLVLAAPGCQGFVSVALTVRLTAR